MKSLQEHLNEALDLKRNSLEREMNSIFSRDIIRAGISLEELVVFAGQALRSSKLKAKDIQNEINRFDSPEELADAIDRNELPDYIKFMDELSHALSISKHSDYCDDIADQLNAAPEFVFDLIELAK